MDRWFSFGFLRNKQTRLRGFGGTAGAVCLGSLSGKTISVQTGLECEIEGGRGKQKLMLGEWQAASVSFHGVLSSQAGFVSAGK